MRGLARGLRPVLLEELGLVPALERLCEDFERAHGIAVAWSCEAPAIPRLDATSETALYRIAQEALANVSRHAGAKRVDLVLGRDHASITLEIRDDGRGFDADATKGSAQRRNGFGLGSMRERARGIGGELAVRRRAEGGTLIAVRVPIRGAPWRA